MTPRPPAIFVADALALDFLNSIATPVDSIVEWIGDGDGLLAWLRQAQLLPNDALRQIRAQALPGELDKVADQARSLREWFRGFVLKHRGGPLTADALAELQPLNRLLERDDAYSRIARQRTGGPMPFNLQPVRRWRSPEALLLPIGEALARFVCTEDFTDVRACEGHACTLLFIDRTRGRARRWCAMAICGNRAKQAAHRERLRSRQR
jgi:predicted RNA-binding Zn ribbon-like protein